MSFSLHRAFKKSGRLQTVFPVSPPPTLHSVFINLSLHVYPQPGINGFSLANCSCVFFCWLVLCFSNQSSEILRLFFQAPGIIYNMCVCDVTHFAASWVPQPILKNYVCLGLERRWGVGMKWKFGFNWSNTGETVETSSSVVWSEGRSVSASVQHRSWGEQKGGMVIHQMLAPPAPRSPPARQVVFISFLFIWKGGVWPSAMKAMCCVLWVMMEVRFGHRSGFNSLCTETVRLRTLGGQVNLIWDKHQLTWLNNLLSPQTLEMQEEQQRRRRTPDVLTWGFTFTVTALKRTVPTENYWSFKLFYSLTNLYFYWIINKTKGTSPKPHYFHSVIWELKHNLYTE